MIGRDRTLESRLERGDICQAMHGARIKLWLMIERGVILSGARELSLRGSTMMTMMVAMLVLSVGCATGMPKMSAASLRLQSLKPKLPEARPDVVELHYIFLEADAKDPKINDEIWASDVDEQCIPLDTKAALGQNGIRLGKIGSRLPTSILTMLEKENETGRRHHASSGQMAKIELTPVLPVWNIFEVIEGKTTGDEIREAQGFIHVTPTITGQTSVALDVVPQIEFGPREPKRVPTPDLAGWQMKTERDARKFPSLRSSVSLASGEYAIIGGIPDATGTIGHKMFTKEVDGLQKQTLLLVRVVRPNRDELLSAGYDFDDFFLTPIKRTVQRATTPVLETVMAAQRISASAVR
ncbi:hypothetical protein K2X85_13725 [bacterium]|nr:hypothetical protein [bacterium]